MGATFLEKFRALPNAEAVYYLVGKMIAALGLGILLVNWFDLSEFIGWVLLILGIALAFPPGVKLLQNQKANKNDKKKK